MNFDIEKFLKREHFYPSEAISDYGRHVWKKNFLGTVLTIEYIEFQDCYNINMKNPLRSTVFDGYFETWEEFKTILKCLGIPHTVEVLRIPEV